MIRGWVELAKQYGRGMTTVRGWVDRGCPHTKDGSVYIFDPLQVDEWLAERDADHDDEEGGDNDTLKRARIRKLQLEGDRLQREKNIEDEKSKSALRSSIEHQEGITRWLSVLLAPLPALFLGGFVLWYRQAGEQRDIAADRRV